MTHPLHVAVAQEIHLRLNGLGELIKDSACGGTHSLPLFIGSCRGRDTRMCQVDMLIVLTGYFKVIIEIEESGFLPTKICGKFLQSAIATHFIHDSRMEHILPYADKVTFVQVLDASKCLKQGSRKDRQAKLIEEKISSIIPLNGSTIMTYRLFFVSGVNDRSGLELVGDAVLMELIKSSRGKG